MRLSEFPKLTGFCAVRVLVHSNGSGPLKPFSGHFSWGRSFLLTTRSFLLTVGLCVAYGTLVWSFFLTVETRFGLFCLRWKSAWFFYLRSPPPPVRKLDLVWEEPSMDQYQCRGELFKNFQDHWSIRISPGKGMDQ